MNKNLLLGATPLVVVCVALVVFGFSEELPTEKLSAPASGDDHSSSPTLESVIQPEATPVSVDAQRLPKHRVAAIGEPVHASASDIPDEARAMAKLRGLLGQDPAAAIKLAQEIDVLFPSSEQAAERHWVIVKSLTDTGDFEGARRKALLMVEQYGDTNWGRDVKRHVLTHPAGPAERNE